MVLPDPIYARSKLVQIEPTPQLLPQPQPQLIPGYNPVAGPQSVPAAPTMSQALGVNAPWGLGPGQTPAAISLLITVGQPVPLYARAKPIDEVLQYAKYCSDEIELKQRKLKEKVMVKQIKASQAGMQGNGIQQMALIPTLAVYDRQGGGQRKHRQQAGGAYRAILTAAVKPRSEKGNRRFPAGFPLAQGILHGGAAIPIPTPFPPACFWRCRMAGTGVVGPLAWAVQGPPNMAPLRLRLSLSALQTVKIATGATAPVAPLQLRRLHSEPASLLQGLSCWAGGRPFGGCPPAQRESRNDSRGLLTAVRSFDGVTLAGGLCRPPKLE
ncbi:hypothetical protein NDU88_004069 [Pleurodeles waltl]|uniref:Uncharacterized protein n=1 Tax=Pleurodeles waltl TaxID=8319 RepID=A0AAV7WQU8_PLEWA|nr:hypothetical protein NDU88_004069 [Pleurodeles waltl]